MGKWKMQNLPVAYDFLKTNPHLGARICYLTLSGSKAYGTDVPTSDTDIRGVALERPEEIYGSKVFEQVEERETDTVVYALRKFVGLCKACNPNVIEMLGTKPEHVLFANDIGRLLQENVGLFLSKKAYVTFTGYATAQLRRLQNALCHDASTPVQQEAHIKKSLESMMRKMQKQYEMEDGSVTFSIGKPGHAEQEEILTSVHIDDVPLRKLLELNNDITNMLRNYGKLNKRNKKKDAMHLRKHAMHLVRLYLTGIDILRGNGVHTYREEDLPLLRGIRSGEVGMDEVFQMIDGYEKEIEQAYQQSPLPAHPDEEAIDEFLVGIYRKYL